MADYQASVRAFVHGVHALVEVVASPDQQQVFHSSVLVLVQVGKRWRSVHQWRVVHVLLEIFIVFNLTFDLNNLWLVCCTLYGFEVC